jgi:hypothetical protein
MWLTFKIAFQIRAAELENFLITWNWFLLGLVGFLVRCLRSWKRYQRVGAKCFGWSNSYSLARLDPYGHLWLQTPFLLSICLGRSLWCTESVYRCLFISIALNCWFWWGFCFWLSVKYSNSSWLFPNNWNKYITLQESLMFLTTNSYGEIWVEIRKKWNLQVHKSFKGSCPMFTKCKWTSSHLLFAKSIWVPNKPSFLLSF